MNDVCNGNKKRLDGLIGVCLTSFLFFAATWAVLGRVSVRAQKAFDKNDLNRSRFAKGIYPAAFTSLFCLTNTHMESLLPTHRAAAASTLSMPWIEKYRPTDFESIVLDPLNRTFFRNVIDKQHFPNLLFYGPPGTGKTTTIINLINEYQTRYTRKNKESVIHLNASDERGIDIVRTQIYQFVRSRHIFESGYKFVILDEVDYMTKNAQQALKTLLQTCHSDVRFCLICNYISKIDESLQQELICVRFNQLPGSEIRHFIRQIADAECLSLTDEQIDLMRETYQSDIRSMINHLQLSAVTSRGPGAFNQEAAAKVPSRSPIVSSTEWEHLLQLMVSRTRHAVDATECLRGLGRSHNVDTKQLLLNFMGFVVKCKSDLVTHSLLSVFEEAAHAKDDMATSDLLAYFVYNAKPMLVDAHEALGSSVSSSPVHEDMISGNGHRLSFSANSVELRPPLELEASVHL